MYDLTPLQQQTYDLREKDGKTFKEIAALLGRSISTVNDNYRVAKMKLAGVVKDKESGNHSLAAENVMEPEQAAEVLDRLTDPFTKLVDVAKECGMKPAVAQALAKRMRTRYLGVTEQMRAVKTNDMIQKIDERIGHALNYIDDYVMADAGFRDLAMGVGILIEKRQLLKGEPTQIISREERQSMNDLLPLLVKEAERRGLSLRVERTVTGSSEPVPPQTKKAAPQDGAVPVQRVDVETGYRPAGAVITTGSDALI